MLRCGLLGETLGHSYSPMIHHALGEYDYRLFEIPKEDLDAFLRSDCWDGLNVTIPYKKAVVSCCGELSKAAERLQSVNTLVHRPDGTLYGDNTDLFGFLYMVRRSGIDSAGKKALVLGSGGASVTVKAALEQLGADVTVISRSGPDDYDHLDRHADAQIIVNTTPVGMYPHNGAAAVDLRLFPQCEGVLDIVYNPALTALLLQAEELGIPCYDHQIIEMIAKENGFDERYVANVSEKSIEAAYPMTIGHRFAMPSMEIMEQPIRVAAAQRQIIENFAKQGDCVIIGRCADVILKDYHPLNLFIYADMEAKVERCIRRAPEGEHLTRNEIERMIKQVDKNRAQYRQMYSDTKWGAKESYHLCVNTTERYMKEIVPGLAAYVRCWFSEE